jgi:signal transduction histidine kinase
LSHELHSSRLQYLSLESALRGLCEECSQQHKVTVEFTSQDLPAAVSADISLCFFRILQEALQNATKHSGAREFRVQLWGSFNQIHLMVSDSGAGFDTGQAKAGRGLGLISMEERVKLLKGTLTIESQLQRGTRVHACVPLKSEDCAQAPT